MCWRSPAVLVLLWVVRTEGFARHNMLALQRGLAPPVSVPMTLVRSLSCPAYRVQDHLQSMSSSGLYNVLHLHTEKQWVEQCGGWEQSQNGGCMLVSLQATLSQAVCNTSPGCRLAAW